MLTPLTFSFTFWFSFFCTFVEFFGTFVEFLLFYLCIFYFLPCFLLSTGRLVRGGMEVLRGIDKSKWRYLAVGGLFRHRFRRHGSASAASSLRMFVVSCCVESGYFLFTFWIKTYATFYKLPSQFGLRLSQNVPEFYRERRQSRRFLTESREFSFSGEADGVLVECR